MIIVGPSYEILDELDRSSLVVRLEACGRICYKSEDKISLDSALPFVKRIAEHGHNSVLEMAVVTIKLGCSGEQYQSLLSCQPKFLILDRIEDGALVTGSIRAFRELYVNHRSNGVVSAMVEFLAGAHPYLFEGVCGPAAGTSGDKTLSIAKFSLVQVEQLPDDLLMRHRWLGVKFIVNRAVTHELVRHRPCSFLQESQRYCRYSQDKFGSQVTFIKPLFYQEGSEEYRRWQQALAETEIVYLELLETSTPQAARTVLPNSCKTEIITYCNLSEWRHIFSLRTIPAAEPSMREIMIPLYDELRGRYPCIKLDK